MGLLGRRPLSSRYGARAAPSATPSSDAAGWTNIFSIAPDATILPLALELSATPPARQRFLEPVFCSANLTTDIIACSQASCTANAIFLWRSEISDSGSRGGPSSDVKWENLTPSPTRVFA